MASIPALGKLLGCNEILEFEDPASWYDKRDAIKNILSKHLVNKPTKRWLEILEPIEIWYAEVSDIEQLV
jgi:CoA:oxalate CoA-transferase